DHWSLRPEAPPEYRICEIKYSKFGVDDFDFGFFNNTPYPGLENNITNSYANSLLQVMHYTPLLRNMALQHAATACLADPCLLCELGYVFDMLQKGEGPSCHATNMLRALNHTSNASVSGVLEDIAKDKNPSTLVKNLTMFLFDKISQDYKGTPPISTELERTLFKLNQPPNPLDLVKRLLETDARYQIKCMHCQHVSPRTATTFVNKLCYPAAKPNIRGMKAQRITFSQVLKAGLENEAVNKGYCTKCQRYQNLDQRKIIFNIPAVLALCTEITTAEHRKLWSTPGWLPEEIGIIVDQGHVYCYEGDDLKLHLNRGIHNITVYSLVGTVVNVETKSPQKSHLVATVNVGRAEPESKDQDRWHLFNDFSVRGISKVEALTFNAAWKMPVVVMFQVKAANHRFNMDWKTRLDTSVLFRDNNPHALKTYELLDRETEIPGPDTVIAIDTEFIRLKEREIHIDEDGKSKTIRPISHAIARASVVRGQGSREGVAFIDDYIHIKETIVDYLTEWSGITPTDLDPINSQRNLVSPKTAYKKLWVLVNLGCKFLGHGLSQDFRVINIQVPRNQVIDTSIIFMKPPSQRKISLAFLAWYLLKEDIQQNTHDSIEDAQTALKLYRKYEEFMANGSFHDVLEALYKKGKTLNFKPASPRRSGC
uniref:PAB-DEPENDENT POLY(A)-SPECIFIC RIBONUCLEASE SUBUNIT PAN2 n=1 Tax=Neurospora crassa TaxID=5141 RepID=UPI00046208E1